MTDPGSKAPVWWDKEVDPAGRPIRLDVRTAAHQIWVAARRQAQHLLGDASEAPELMENAVAQVSRYLDRSGADLFTQNTAGILMCAICRSLRRYARKLNRLELVGGSAELSDRRIAPDWTALVELRLDLERLTRSLNDKSRTMLDLRRSGFDWKEIADVLQMTDVAARAAFWRGVKRAKLRTVGTARRKSVKQLPGVREQELDPNPVRGNLAPEAEAKHNPAPQSGVDGSQTLLRASSPFPECDNWARGFGVKRRLGYKGYVIEARSHELRDGGFSAEFSVEEHDARGVTETQFYVPNTFATQESAIEAAIQAGEQKIDTGFERGQIVANG
jgi:hypothetical protein